jgi:hypothetical protein
LMERLNWLALRGRLDLWHSLALRRRLDRLDRPDRWTLRRNLLCLHSLLALRRSLLS